MNLPWACGGLMKPHVRLVCHEGIQWVAKCNISSHWIVKMSYTASLGVCEECTFRPSYASLKGVWWL